jgi:hypothetical protein
MDPRIHIRIRIHTKMSWTTLWSCVLSFVLPFGHVIWPVPYPVFRPIVLCVPFTYLSFFLQCLPRYPSAVLLCPLSGPASLFLNFTFCTYNLVILIGVCCGSALASAFSADPQHQSSGFSTACGTDSSDLGCLTAESQFYQS